MQADYSLSCHHVYVGLFAELMVNAKRYSPLEFVPLLPHSSLPSWVPNWKACDQWSIELEPKHFHEYHMDQNRSSTLAQMIPQLQPDRMKQYGYLNSSRIDTVLLPSNELLTYRDYLGDKKRVSRTKQDVCLRSYTDFVIDRRTGGLHKAVVRLFTLQTRPNWSKS